MLRNFFEGQDDEPPEIAWFERLWLVALAMTVLITSMMFDWSAGRLGPYGAGFMTFARFGGSILLMLFCSRRRSNLARWIITIPFALTLVAYDGIRLPYMLERNPVMVFVVLRQILLWAAISMLFTPRSRAWFAGRPPPQQPPENLQFL